MRVESRGEEISPMNPLTLVKRIQEINKKEATLGISEEASWHVKYRDSAYVYVGGIPFELTEGDLLAVFAQYGEIVDVNLIRDKGTGKSKGFAFLAYEDQRSTNLAVDNLNGAQILGRTIRVDHMNKYKKLEEEDEETRQQKREERGVCRAFMKGGCTYGDGCKFSHDEQRAANTGWGAEEDRRSRWAHDKFERSVKDGKPGRLSHVSGGLAGTEREFKRNEKESHETLSKSNVKDQEQSYEGTRRNGDDWDGRIAKKQPEQEAVTKHKDDRYDKRPEYKDDRDDRHDKRHKIYDYVSSRRDERHGKEREKRFRDTNKE